MAMNNITLTSGMRSNLFSLQQTQNMMETTQTRLSSGKTRQLRLG
jgi:flagellin